MTADISILIAIIGCFVGLAGWLTRRDTKISDDAEWKGTIDTKLDNIGNGVVGINDRMAKMEGKLEEHETRITVLESKVDRKEHTA